jgi:hypothetical protein
LRLRRTKILHSTVILKSKPAAVRVRLGEATAPDAVPLALPAQSMLGVSLFLAAAFVIFGAIEWMTIAGMFRHRIEDVFDLTFLVFQGFWALGWSVGVLLLGVLTVLFAFYSESARLEAGKLVHIPRLGPLKILIDYDLARVSNVRAEQAGGSDPDMVQVRFDYDGSANALGNAMPRSDAKRIVDAITSAGRFNPHAVHRQYVAPQEIAGGHTRDGSGAARAESLPLTSTSAVALVFANLVPVAGVLFLGWDLGTIMLLYWAESGVIAFYTAIKIAIVAKLGAIAAVPFFIGHFGGFMAAHFLLVYGLFLRNVEWQAMGTSDALRAIFIPIWGSIAVLFISHGVSFYTNFLGEREYERATVKALMTAPYRRIMVMHFTLIFGGWIIMLVGVPGGALVVLLLLKTAGDLQAHRSEHTRVG